MWYGYMPVRSADLLGEHTCTWHTCLISRVASTCHLLHVVLLQRDPAPRHACQPPRHVRHPRVVPAHVAVAEVVSEDEHDVGPRLLGRAGCSFSSEIWMYLDLDPQPADKKNIFVSPFSVSISLFSPILYILVEIIPLKCSGTKSLLSISYFT